MWPQCWLCAVCAVGHGGCCVGGRVPCGGKHIIIKGPLLHIPWVSAPPPLKPDGARFIVASFSSRNPSYIQFALYTKKSKPRFECAGKGALGGVTGVLRPDVGSKTK